MSQGKKFIILSKDAMCKDYLHFYGQREGQFPTPNIDNLVAQGTLFKRHYAAAASTIMSFYSMCLGVFAHETDIQMYEPCHKTIEGETLFTRLKEIGYDQCHIIWDELWDVIPTHYNYFRDDVTVHSIHHLRESVGVHKKKEGALFSDDEKAQAMLDKIESLIAKIVDENENVFIWLHMPHVICGRACYGADIDMFDRYAGMVRKYFPDNCIAITADHGNFNGSKGKLAYGFDVYDKIACIPMITPRIGDYKEYNEPTSNVDLYTILFEKAIPKREFVYCDSAYRAQKTRKLAIVQGNYKYIYNKRENTEELYDLRYDPDESLSLMSDTMYDVDRHITVSIREEYFYPYWGEINEIRRKMRIEKNRIWRNGDFKIVVKSNLKDVLRPIANKIEQIKKKKMQ